MTAAKCEFMWIDGSNERTRTQLHVAGLTTGLVSVVLADANLLRDALESVTTLNEVKVSVDLTAHTATPSLPSSPWAQREHGARMRYADNVTGKLYRFDIPGVDETVVRTPGTDEIDLAVEPFASFKTAFELTALSEVGNAVTLVGGRFYGKNS